MPPTPPVPSHRWRAEAEAEAKRPKPDLWVLRFIGALDEIDRLRELCESLRSKATVTAVNLPTLAILLRGMHTVGLPPTDSGSGGWDDLAEHTRERWINYAGHVVDGVRRWQQPVDPVRSERALRGWETSRRNTELRAQRDAECSEGRHDGNPCSNCQFEDFSKD